MLCLDEKFYSAIIWKFIIFPSIGLKKMKIKSMFGYWTQIQFSVFESNFLRVPLSFFLFGNFILILNSNPITVQMILKSTF
jgi:hypothetical protein